VGAAGWGLWVRCSETLAIKARGNGAGWEGGVEARGCARWRARRGESVVMLLGVGVLRLLSGGREGGRWSSMGVGAVGVRLKVGASVVAARRSEIRVRGRVVRLARC
jgi:hypothetical protein